MNKTTLYEEFVMDLKGFKTREEDNMSVEVRHLVVC